MLAPNRLHAWVDLRKFLWKNHFTRKSCNYWRMNNSQPNKNLNSRSVSIRARQIFWAGISIRHYYHTSVTPDYTSTTPELHQYPPNSTTVSSLNKPAMKSLILSTYYGNFINVRWFLIVQLIENSVFSSPKIFKTELVLRFLQINEKPIQKMIQERLRPKLGALSDSGRGKPSSETWRILTWSKAD